MTFRNIVLTAFFALAFAAPARAEFQTETLFSARNWTVELTHDTSDGQLWCAAQTVNNRDQAFDLTAFDTGAMTVFFFDHSWDLAERTVETYVDIDRSRWEIDADAGGIALSVSLEDKDNAAEFVNDLAKGQSLTLLNLQERKLASFSLSGSRAAITSLMECWESITTSNPFQKASDPF